MYMYMQNVNLISMNACVGARFYGFNRKAYYSMAFQTPMGPQCVIFSVWCTADGIIGPLRCMR